MELVVAAGSSITIHFAQSRCFSATEKIIPKASESREGTEAMNATANRFPRFSASSYRQGNCRRPHYAQLTLFPRTSTEGPVICSIHRSEFSRCERFVHWQGRIDFEGLLFLLISFGLLSLPHGAKPSQDTNRPPVKPQRVCLSQRRTSQILVVQGFDTFPRVTHI